ncbi:MFS general substrate transporter [Schizopora paradoxa]|uniref:MFS general substrate transporter n=1 Tax=Schizopora paradoxa TaxID=27342 RepID=A0A0H2RR29_9AGAM|nr:MFS general substrate transporter [Schizopora paradoxa]
MSEEKGIERSTPSDDELTINDERTKETPTREDAEKYEIETPSQPQVKWTWKKVFLVAVTTCAMILNILTITAASVGLPSVGRDFNVEEDKLQWIVSAYSLSSGCLLIFFGRLADLYGRKKAFLLGFLWHCAFSLGCGFANSIIVLDVLRAMQGMGAAAFVPASVGILAHAFPESRARSIAFATFSAGAPVGGALGLQLGGVLTQWAPDTWRAPYFLTAGLAVPVFIGGLFTIDWDVASTETADQKRVDWLGAILVTSSLVLIQFVLAQGELAPKGWKTPYIIALLIAGVLLLFAFLAWQYYLEHVAVKSRPPLMKLSMWKRAKGKFAVTQSIAFVEWCSFQSWTFWSQLFYQDYQGYAPFFAALRQMPMVVVGVSCNIIVALVVGHVDFVLLVIVGTLCTSLSGLLFALINPDAPYWAFGFPAAILSVFGADFVFAAGSLFVAKVALPHEQSLAGGLFQTLTQLGTALGLAVTTIVHNSVLRQRTQLDAYKAAQWTAFGFGVLGAVLAAVFLRGVGPVGHRPSPSSKPDEENPTSTERMSEKS